MKKAVLALVCLLAIGGCSSKQERDLVGKWRETKDPRGVLIFLADHKGRAYWPDESKGQDSCPMTWSLDADKVTTVTPQGPLTFTLKSGRLLAPNGLELKKTN